MCTFPCTLPSRMRDDWLGWYGRCLLGMLVVVSAASADVRSPVELSGGASAKAALHNMARARLAKVAAASCVPPPNTLRVGDRPARRGRRQHTRVLAK